MRHRAIFSLVAAAVLLVSNQASGNLTGTFGSISFSHPPCAPPVVCSGQGTNSFTWGAPLNAGENPSRLTFTASAFNASLGVPVVVGHLDFFNGTLAVGSEVTTVGLTFTSGDVDATGADSPAFEGIFDNYLFSLTLAITNTPNTDDPVASRDDIVVTSSLVTVPGQGTQNFTFEYNPNVFSVNENANTNVELKARFGSIVLVGFGDVADPELGGVSFVPVPEPSTFLLFGGGLTALVLTRRGRSGLRHHE